MAALIKPVLQRLALPLAGAGVTADAITAVSLCIGLTGSALIAAGHPALGLPVLLLSRLGDGLDGAVARLGRPSDRGGFLDIVFDFLFYASVPLAFAWADPQHNALAAATLLAAFMGTASSFLAYSALAARQGLAKTTYPDKSIHFLGGLTEASETLLVFAAMCLWPQHFAILAWVFSALCVVTTVTRIWFGWKTL